MINIGVTFKGLTQVVWRFNGLATTLPAKINSGLRVVGLLVKAQIQKNLSGASHSKGASQSYLPIGSGGRVRIYIDQAPWNPFPGVGYTGHLRASVESIPDPSSLSVRIGPHSIYGAIHEFGGVTGRNHATHIPARPYVFPAWETVKDQAMAIFSETVFGAIVYERPL